VNTSHLVPLPADYQVIQIGLSLGREVYCILLFHLIMGRGTMSTALLVAEAQETGRWKNGFQMGWTF